MSDQQEPRGERTETIIRKYDVSGRLVSETTQTVITVKPDPEPAEHTGFYL